MKLLKRLPTLMLACLLLAFFAVPALAAEPSADSQATYFDDGSYLVKTVLVTATARASNTTSGRATYDCYSLTDQLLWTAWVDGTFTYDGSSATATKASYNYVIYSDAWSLKSGRAYCSGNQAIAEVKFSGGIFATRTVNLVLTCSPDGKLS